jgi:flavorubredoxin
MTVSENKQKILISNYKVWIMETLNRLEIKKTHSTPEVIFEVDGNLKMKGRIMTDNAGGFFQPLIEWVENIECKKVILDIDLEYLNTSASMQLFKMVNKLSQNCMVEEVEVIWHYEEDDDDHLETGQVYEEKLSRVKFRFLRYA